VLYSDAVCSPFADPDDAATALGAAFAARVDAAVATASPILSAKR